MNELAENIKTHKLGTYSIDPEADALIQTCPMCGTEHDVAKMDSTVLTELLQARAVCDIALAVFNLIVEASEKKSPLMQQVGIRDRDTGDEYFQVDIWAGIGDTPIKRIAVKNRQIESLKAELAALAKDHAALQAKLMENNAG